MATRCACHSVCCHVGKKACVRLLEVCLYEQVIFDSVNSSAYSVNVRGGQSL